MSILIMGAGNTGSIITQELLSLDADFKVMLRDTSKA